MYLMTSLISEQAAGGAESEPHLPTQQVSSQSSTRACSGVDPYSAVYGSGSAFWIRIYKVGPHSECGSIRHKVKNREKDSTDRHNFAVLIQDFIDCDYLLKYFLQDGTGIVLHKNNFILGFSSNFAIYYGKISGSRSKYRYNIFGSTTLFESACKRLYNVMYNMYI